MSGIRRRLGSVCSKLYCEKATGTAASHMRAPSAGSCTSRAGSNRRQLCSSCLRLSSTSQRRRFRETRLTPTSHMHPLAVSHAHLHPLTVSHAHLRACTLRGAEGGWMQMLPEEGSRTAHVFFLMDLSISVLFTAELCLNIFSHRSLLSLTPHPHQSLSVSACRHQGCVPFD